VVGEEDRHLAELHLLALVDVARGAQDDEVHLALVVLLDLRAQVEALGVLDGEVVQAEAVLHVGELLGRGLEQPEPDEAAVALADLRGALELHGSLVLPAPVAVVRAVDDHGGLLAFGDVGHVLLHPNTCAKLCSGSIR
jgi:hypothetical protein